MSDIIRIILLESFSLSTPTLECHIVGKSFRCFSCKTRVVVALLHPQLRYHQILTVIISANFDTKKFLNNSFCVSETILSSMTHYLEEQSHLVFNHHDYQPKPLNMDTKIQENKGSFCIDALLSRSEDRPTSPDTSRSISPTSTRSRSPPISPGSEEIPPNPFVPRPGLLNHIYPNGGAFYGYPGQTQGSAFHSIDGSMVQKVQLPINHHNHSQFHQMQLEWLARTGMFYQKFPDLTGKRILW